MRRRTVQACGEHTPRRQGDLFDVSLKILKAMKKVVFAFATLLASAVLFSEKGEACAVSASCGSETISCSGNKSCSAVSDDNSITVTCINHDGTGSVAQCQKTRSMA
jgi:hypothetical protein